MYYCIRLIKIEAEYEITLKTRVDYDESTAYAALQEAYKRSQERENEVQQELLNAHRMLASMEHELHFTRERLESAQLNYRTIDAKTVTLREEIVSYQKRISELEEKYEICRETNEEQEDEITILQHRMTELTNQNKTNQDSKAQLVVEVTTLKTRIVRLETQIDDSEREKDQLRVQLSAYRSKGEVESQDVSRTLEDLQNRNNSYRMQMEDLQRALNDKDNDFQKGVGEISFLKSEVDNLRRARELESTAIHVEPSESMIRSFFSSEFEEDETKPAESTRYGFDEEEGGGETVVTSRKVVVKKSAKGKKKTPTS